MDGQTLINLEIFNNNADGSQTGMFFKPTHAVTSMNNHL